MKCSTKFIFIFTLIVTPMVSAQTFNEVESSKNYGTHVGGAQQEFEAEDVDHDEMNAYNEGYDKEANDGYEVEMPADAEVAQEMDVAPAIVEEEVQRDVATAPEEVVEEQVPYEEYPDNNPYVDTVDQPAIADEASY